MLFDGQSKQIFCAFGIAFGFGERSPPVIDITEHPVRAAGPRQQFRFVEVRPGAGQCAEPGLGLAEVVEQFGGAFGRPQQARFGQSFPVVSGGVFKMLLFFGQFAQRVQSTAVYLPVSLFFGHGARLRQEVVGFIEVVREKEGFAPHQHSLVLDPVGTPENVQQVLKCV